MKFPSEEFDDAITAMCHGTIAEDRMSGVHRLLADDPMARDEYLWQVELHSRLASVRGLGRDLVTFNERVAGMKGIRERRLHRPVRYLGWAAIAGGVCVAAYLAISTLFAPGERKGSVKGEQPVAEQSTSANGSASASFGATPQSGTASAAGLIRPNVRFAWAQDAPVIVGTGLFEPLPLGAFVPYEHYGHTLHVWDWLKGDSSRVYKDVRLMESQRFALTPDGKLLVTSQGTMIDLGTGEIGRIDLGPEFYSNQGDHLRRIQELLFSPEGGRLALLATNVDLAKPSHPLLHRDVRFSAEIQILKFPEGQLLSRFPAGHGSAPRFAFSASGARVVSATPTDGQKQQIIERETDTGKVIRSYEPEVEGHAYALAMAPNGERLAVFDGAGALLLWDTRTGALLHRIDSVRTESYATALRFSPDGRHLAVNAVQKSFVVDVETGKVLATIPQVNAAHFLWSDDGSRLTIVTGHSYYDGAMLPMYNEFPAVFEWNWREVKLVRSHDSPPPARKDVQGSSRR